MTRTLPRLWLALVVLGAPLHADELPPAAVAAYLGAARAHAAVVEALGEDREILESADRYELMELDEEPSYDEEQRTFHTFAVKRAFVIPGRRGQLAVTRALYQGFDTRESSDDWRPSHGIRAVKSGRTLDLVISLPSFGVMVHRGPEASRVFPLSDAPGAVFEAMAALRARGKVPLDDEARDVLENAETLVVCAIEPGRGSSGFLGHPIRRQREITSAALRASLVNALYGHLDKGKASKSFKPRHAVRATSFGATVELLIAFDSEAVSIHAGGKPRTISLHPGCRELFARLVDRPDRAEVVAKLGALHAPVAGRLPPEAMALLEETDQIEVLRYGTNAEDEHVLAARHALEDEAERWALVEATFRAIGPAPPEGEDPPPLAGPFYMLRFQRDAHELRLTITREHSALWSVQRIEDNVAALRLPLAAPAPLVGWLEKKAGKLGEAGK